MFNEKLKRAICVMSSAVMLGTSLVPSSASAASLQSTSANPEATDTYAQRFLEYYNIITNNYDSSIYL